MTIDTRLYEKNDAAARAVAKAEKAIQNVLADLEQEISMSVDAVEVDTRNFAQLKTEIFVTKKQRV